MSLKDSKTEQNLKDAFAGESQANRRYLYFAAKADVEGYNDVAAVFRSTAEGETGHAHGHLEYLEEAGDPATGLPIGATDDPAPSLELTGLTPGQTYYVQISEGQSNFDPNYSSSAFGPGQVPQHLSPLLSRLTFKPTRGFSANFLVESSSTSFTVSSRSVANSWYSPSRMISSFLTELKLRFFIVRWAPSPRVIH